MKRASTLIAAALAFASELAGVAVRAQDSWENLGLVRTRDLTPFGISRLDFLPAHAVDTDRGALGLEIGLSYQNTYLLSDEVEAYLAGRGSGRRSLTSADVDAISALPGDAVFVDGELALLDLTFHVGLADGLSAYATFPTYTFQGGFLDASIESFHDRVGFDSAGRDLVDRNQFQVVYSVEGETVVLLGPPDDFSLGDPVVGLRWSIGERDNPWHLVLEAAAKLAWRNEQTIVSTGRTDYGLQATVQRRYAKTALYASTSLVWFGGAELIPGVEDELIPTVILGLERRLTQRTNVVLQGYASRSVVQNTTIDELTSTKYQLTLGLVSRRGRHAWRCAVTENIVSFENTPDIGFSFGYAVALRGGWQ